MHEYTVLRWASKRKSAQFCKTKKSEKRYYGDNQLVIIEQSGKGKQLFLQNLPELYYCPDSFNGSIDHRFNTAKDN